VIKFLLKKNSFLESQYSFILLSAASPTKSPTYLMTAPLSKNIYHIILFCLNFVPSFPFPKEQEIWWYIC